MEQKSNAFLETEKLSTLMRKYSLPCIISLVVAALYNIVDQIFIANADYLGSYGNAANTVVFPLTVVALAIAVMIGDGACAFVSISLGADRKDDAHRSIGNAIVLCLGSSLLLTAVYLLAMEPILTFFGGKVNAETYACAKEYFFWIALGMPFYMFGQAMNPIIRSDGSPRFAMVSTVAGAVTNIILDPIFIFPLKMGMMGAAIATVAGQILTAGLAVWYLFHMKAVKLQESSFALKGKLIRRFLLLGVTSFLSQISLVISMAAVQNMVTKYGAQDSVFGQAEYAQIPLAVLGIVMKFFQIAISISVGLAAGCIPVVGYNIGAGRRDRAKDLFTMMLGWEAAVGLIALLIVELLPRQLIGIFGAAAAAADRHLRRGQRERLLHHLRHPLLPHLSLYDGVGHGQQGYLHLSAGPGQGRAFHDPVAGKRDHFRGLPADPAAALLRLGRCPLLLPDGGCADLYSDSSRDHQGVP